MKNLQRAKKSMIFYCLLGALLIFPGCVNMDLKKAFPDIKTHALELNAPSNAAFSGTPVSVRVNIFSSTPYFGDRYWAYRTGETSYEQDFYHQWISAPAEMLQDQVLVWLKEAPFVTSVLTPVMAESAGYGIDGRLLDLSGDYRVENAPKAVAKIQLTVSDLDAENPVILFQKIYAAEIPMKTISPQTLIEGWNTGLGQIMTGFEGDLRESLAHQKED